MIWSCRFTLGLGYSHSDHTESCWLRPHLGSLGQGSIWSLSYVRCPDPVSELESCSMFQTLVPGSPCISRHCTHQTQEKSDPTLPLLFPPLHTCHRHKSNTLGRFQCWPAPLGGALFPPPGDSLCQPANPQGCTPYM